MSILGIGIDVADVSRFARLLEARGDAFTRKWFSDGEIADCRGSSRVAHAFAETFAVKEAVWKAVGARATWSGPLPWRCIVLDRRGCTPRVTLDGAVAAQASRLGVVDIHVSYASRGQTATATAVACAGGG